MKFPVVKPPIPLPENAILTLKSLTEEKTLDPETGEPVYTPKTKTVKASLTWSTQENKDKDQPGANFHDIDIVGYLTTPKTFPTGYISSGVVPCVLKTSRGDKSGELTFKLLETPFDKSPIAQSIGTPIQGTFRLRGDA